MQDRVEVNDRLRMRLGDDRFMRHWQRVKNVLFSNVDIQLFFGDESADTVL